MSYVPVGWANDETHPLSQANMKVLDAGIVAADRGWVDITEPGGQVITSGHTFSIPTGEFDMVKVRARGSLTDFGYLNLRVNDDSTSGLHLRSILVLDPNTGEADVNFTDAAASWRLAQWDTSTNNIVEATIYATDLDPGLLSMQSEGFRSNTTASQRRRSLMDGRLAFGRTLDSIRLFGAVGANINSVRVWIEGHRA